MANNYLFYPGEEARVENGAITLDLLMKEPTRIARMVSTMVESWMFTDKLFAGNIVSGGSMVFNVITREDANILTEDEPGEIAPGANYPRLHVSSREPKTTRVKKIGGEFAMTDVAVKRNDEAYFSQANQRLARRMTHSVDSLGIEAIKAALKEYDSELIKVQSGGWAAIGKTKAADQVRAKSIRADLNKAANEVFKTGLVYNYDTLILNPDDHLNFLNAFETDTEANNFLGSKGLTVIPTPYIEAGKAWLAAGGQLGVMGVESPISTITYREESRDSTIIKTNATFGYAVTDPLALIQIENIGA